MALWLAVRLYRCVVGERVESEQVEQNISSLGAPVSVAEGCCGAVRRVLV